MINVLKKNIISLFVACIFCGTAHAENLELTYGEHETFDRFVFQFKNKPEYKVTGDSYMTILQLPKDTKIINKNLNQYSRKSLMEEKDGENNHLFIIPAPTVKHFEVEGKIVIDVKSHRAIKGEISPNSVGFLDFSWDKEIDLAAFMRNGYLWLVFDGYKDFDVEKMLENNQKYVEEIYSINQKISLIKIKLKNNVGFKISKRNFAWVITFTQNSIAENKEVLTAKTAFSENGNKYISIPVETVGNVIMTVDPENGDILMIAPITEPNLGVGEDYKYAELKLFKTFQGVVIEAFTDDLTMAKHQNEIAIGAKDRSLNISY